jgi:hypothetical protein
MSSPASASLPVSLLIPGLIWPTQALSDLTHDLSLPAFSRLLDGGRLVAQPGSSCSELVAQKLGAPLPLPSAALRRITLGQAADKNSWLCLDPIHLGFVERALTIGDPQDLALTADEARTFAVALAPTFSEFGEIEVTTPQAWHLRLKSDRVHLSAPALHDLIGGRADSGLAALDPAWRKALNEAQMLLHSHPLNQERDNSGRVKVNSVWPWGAGALDPESSRTTVQRPARLWADSLDLRGLGHYLGLTSTALPPRWTAPEGTTLIVIDTLSQSARRADAIAWRAELERLEENWFAPLVADLQRGHPATLHIDFIGDTQGLALDCSRFDLMLGHIAFWRKPGGLQRLAPPIAATTQRPHP